MAHQAYLRDRKLDNVKGLIAITLTGAHEGSAREWCKARWGAANAPEMITRAAVDATTVSDFGLGNASILDEHLFSAVREMSILHRIRPRRAGFYGRMIASGGVAGSEVTEGTAIPAVKPTWANGGVTPRKFAGMTLATQEALDAAPGIEQVIFSDIAGGITDALNSALLAPGTSGSLTNGLTAVVGSSDAAADIEALVADFDGDLGRAYFVLPPKMAVSLAGLQIGRDVGARGGDIAGIPALTARGIPDGQVTLIDGDGILAAYDETARIGSSQEASVEASDAPTNDATTGTGASLISLFQVGAWSFRGILRAGWLRARTGSVSVLTGATW